MKRNKIKTTNWVCEKDLSQYTDSMLFESGEEIASADFIAQGRKCTVDLVVRGSVKVFYKGEVYKSVSQFPESLVNIIRNDEYWDCHEDVEAVDTNYFEYLYGDEMGPIDGLVCEDNISSLSIEGLHSKMETIAEWYYDGLDEDQVEDE